MSLLSLTKEIAIDLGTANTIIITDGKIAVEEPSVVAIRKSDDKMMAVGRKASAMIGRGEDRIYTVRPLKKGVIADYKACEMMIRGLIDLIPQRKRLFKPSIRMVVCVPSGATDAEMRIINDSCVHAGAKELYLIYEPQAAALGMFAPPASNCCRPAMPTASIHSRSFRMPSRETSPSIQCHQT